MKKFNIDDCQEITTRKGKRVVFLRMADFLMDYYGCTEEDIPTHETSNHEHIVHCPFCKREGHSKHKLYIKGDLTAGHCFVCCREFIGIDDELHFDIAVPETTLNFGGYWKEPWEVVKLPDNQEWNLDKFEWDFDDYDKKGVEYLLGRHKYLGELWKILGFKFCDGNIVMPFFWKGELIYYQIRFTGASKIRYFFPPIKKKPPYIIHRDGISKLIICEGIYDAIANLILFPSYIPVAVMGSSINDYQLEFIRSYVPTEILIYMDETEISQRIADRIKTAMDYCKIRIVKSDGQDPEEKLKELIATGRGDELGWYERKMSKQDSKPLVTVPKYKGLW